MFYDRMDINVDGIRFPIPVYTNKEKRYFYAELTDFTEYDISSIPKEISEKIVYQDATPCIITDSPKELEKEMRNIIPYICKNILDSKQYVIIYLLNSEKVIKGTDLHLPFLDVGVFVKMKIYCDVTKKREVEYQLVSSEDKKMFKIANNINKYIVNATNLIACAYSAHTPEKLNGTYCYVIPYEEKTALWFYQLLERQDIIKHNIFRTLLNPDRIKKVMDLGINVLFENKIT